MFNNIEENYLGKIQSDSYENNSTTKIAIVRKLMYGMSNMDENIEDLAPPVDLLEEFWDKKEETSHNDAWEEVKFKDRYISYLEENEDLVENIVERAKDGEKIELICYEKPPKKCHRHILIDFIHNNFNKL